MYPMFLETTIHLQTKFTVGISKNAGFSEDERDITTIKIKPVFILLFWDNLNGEVMRWTLQKLAM